MTIRLLVEKHLHAYVEKFGKEIVLEGPELRFSTAESQSLSTALHELATNAAKYGASGRVEIQWQNIDCSGYQIEWREEGLQDVMEPESVGFGSMILTKILPSQLNGKAFREFSNTAHTYRLIVKERQNPLESRE